MRRRQPYRATDARTRPRPATVTVSPATAPLTALGTTVQLMAEVRDQNAGVMAGATVTWSSGDTSVATVDASGLVTAVGNGTATITASAGSASGSAVVAVTQSVATVAVTQSVADLTALGATVQLTAEAFDANGHAMAAAEFSWESSDISVATVDTSGLVTGVAEGVATITASAGSGQGTAEITVMDLERAALVALYEATDGPNWVNSENWLTDAPLGDWYGVDTDSSGRIVRLNLAGRWDSAAREWIAHGLAGSIPAELGNLANLKVLQLNANVLTGSVPAELGNLANLETLHLGYNGLSGSIPPELGNLADLESLNLSFNSLTGTIPTELGGLASLTSLLLNDNDLEGSIPVSFSSLGRLQHLGLDAHHCAPADPQLQAWLRERNFLDPCDSKPPPNPHPDPDVLFGSTPSNVITVLDPTAYDSVVYVGRGIRRMRTGSGSQLDVNAFLFTAHFHDAELALEVHANYGNHEAAAAAARPYLAAMGRLPRVLITGSRLVQVSPEGGTAAQPCYRAYYWASPHGKHTEEVALHEGVHAALQDCPTGVHCPADCDGPTDLDDWAEAALADSIYISRYGRNHARNGRFYEDMADTFWAWFVSRCEPERLHPEFKRQIDENLPNRLAYFDGLHLDMHPWQCGETSRTANRSSTPRSWWMPDPRSPTPPVRIASPD